MRTLHRATLGPPSKARRIIFAKIDEVYLDEKKGYTNPWTDAAVARDLGVPKAWVAQVRDEMFGPAGSNEQFDEFMAKVVELRKEHDAVAERLQNLGIGLSQTGKKIEMLELVARKIEKEIGNPPARRV